MLFVCIWQNYLFELFYFIIGRYIKRHLFENWLSKFDTYKNYIYIYISAPYDFHVFIFSCIRYKLPYSYIIKVKISGIRENTQEKTRNVNFQLTRSKTLQIALNMWKKSLEYYFYRSTCKY